MRGGGALGGQVVGGQAADRPRRPARDRRVHEDGAVVAGHPLHQPQAAGLLLLDVHPGRAVQPLADEGRHLQPHGVVAEEGVAEAQDQRAHARDYPRSWPASRSASRRQSRPRPTDVVSPGGWAARPAAGSARRARDGKGNGVSVTVLSPPQFRRRTGGHSLDEPSGCAVGTNRGADSIALVESDGCAAVYSGAMHREASPDRETPALTPRTRARRRLRLLAVLLNVVLFGAGLYFQAHPRDRHDLWSAGGVAAVAIVNSAALSVPTRGRAGAHFVARLRRIALFANTLLLVTAAVIVAALGPARLAARGAARGGARRAAAADHRRAAPLPARVAGWRSPTSSSSSRAARASTCSRARTARSSTSARRACCATACARTSRPRVRPSCTRAAWSRRSPTSTSWSPTARWRRWRSRTT